MKTKKLRLTAIILFCVLLLGALVGCAQKPADSASTTPKVTTEPSSGLEPGDHVTKEYYENGVLKKEETITVNVHHVVQKSDVKLYREDGSLEKHTVYKLGTGNDLVVFTEEIFFENEKTEKYTEYYTDGVIKIQSVYNENGTLKSCAKNYINGNPESEFVYDENGVAQKYCTYYTNGNKKEEKLGNITISFYENGNVKEVYIYEYETPIKLEYYETGVLKTKSEYFLDIEAGYKYTEKEYTRYNENGKKAYTDSYYTDTAEQKESIGYHSDGETISSRTTYYNLPGEGNVDEYFEYDENGVLTFYRDYDEKGNIVEEYKRPK